MLGLEPCAVRRPSFLPGSRSPSLSAKQALASGSAGDMWQERAVRVMEWGESERASERCVSSTEGRRVLAHLAVPSRVSRSRAITHSPRLQAEDAAMQARLAAWKTSSPGCPGHLQVGAGVLGP